MDLPGLRLPPEALEYKLDTFWHSSRTVWGWEQSHRLSGSSSIHIPEKGSPPPRPGAQQRDAYTKLFGTLRKADPVPPPAEYAGQSIFPRIPASAWCHLPLSFFSRGPGSHGVWGHALALQDVRRQGQLECQLGRETHTSDWVLDASRIGSKYL